MSLYKKKYVISTVCAVIILVIALRFTIIHSKNYSLLDQGFIQNKEIIDNVAREFDISSRILVSVLYAERGLNYSFLDEELDFVLIEAGVNASSGFSQIKYRTAMWIEDQMTNKHGQYWIDQRRANLVGKSKNQKELIKKLSSTEANVRFAAAYLAMMIKRWDKDSLNISCSPDTLGTMYSSGICSSKKLTFINIVGRTAQAFYESDRLEEYFPRE